MSEEFIPNRGPRAKLEGWKPVRGLGMQPLVSAIRGLGCPLSEAPLSGSFQVIPEACARLHANFGEAWRNLANPQRHTRKNLVDIHQSSGEGPPHSPELRSGVCLLNEAGIQNLPSLEAQKGFKRWGLPAPHHSQRGLVGGWLETLNLA